jgi:DNA-binding NtrC family response regulator
VVEDEPLILMDIEDFLTRWGVGKVTGVATIEKAMEALGGNTIRLALLDVHLGGETSLEFAQELASRGVPFVFTSGSGSADLPPEVAQVPFFEKPFDWQALQAAMASALIS